MFEQDQKRDQVPEAVISKVSSFIEQQLVRLELK